MPRRDLLRAAPDRRGCPPFPKVPEALSRASPLGLSLAAFSHKPLKNLERARGFEPPTPTLARLCSTPELHPHPRPPSYKPEGKFAKACLGPPWAASCAPRHEPPAVARGSVPPARCARHRTPHLFASAGVHRRRGGGATWIKAIVAYRRRYLAALWVLSVSKYGQAAHAPMPRLAKLLLHRKPGESKSGTDPALFFRLLIHPDQMVDRRLFGHVLFSNLAARQACLCHS
jgi:hypothetical protein